ncbi:MAG TPA: ABC transporter permease [Vicinamibacterales bacterium]|nr:ABC transporter permease [Vicinamibacterales bacterium]
MSGSILIDVQTAWRSYRRQPGVVAAIVLSLALGLGAATAMFSVARAVLLAPLPYRQPERLVTVWSRWESVDRTWLASADVRDIRARSQLIDGMAMWTWDRMTLTGIGDATSLNAGIVTANTFEVLGASPLYGRVFTEAEALAATTSGRTMFAVLGYDLWRSTFAGDPAVVGRSVTIDDHPVTVLGVMPPRFQLPTDFTRAVAAPTQLWTPIHNDPAMNEGGHSYYGAARLRAGVSLPAFTTELATFAVDFSRRKRNDAASQFAVFAEPIHDDVFAGVRPMVRVLAAGVSVLFLIACANAAALLVARAETRRREWATRVALGAGRLRLLRLQIVEATLLALAGGTLGISLAVFAGNALQAVGSTAIPRAGDVTIDWRVVAFMVALAVVAAVVSSLTPAMHAVRLNVVDGLRGARGVSASRGQLRLRALLVVSQLSLGMLLLTGAGLLGRTLLAMRDVDLGFDAAHVLTARVTLPATRYSRPEEVDAYFGALTTRLRQSPGIQSAGLVRVLPLGQGIGNWPVTIEGQAPGTVASGDWQVVTPDGLEALGERLVRGRFFSDADTAAAPVVALVNEAMARAYWPGRDPVGRRLRFSNDAPLVWATVVGVVGDVRHAGVTSQVKPKFYLPYAQFPAATGDDPIAYGTIVLRGAGDPLRHVAALRAAAASVDRTVPVIAVRPMTDVVDTALTTPRLTSGLVIVLAAIALVLAALGLFGLLAYLVAQRAQEIGIRIAIGAGPGAVVRLVLAQGLRVLGVGLAVGLLLSALATRGLSSLLYGVRPWDPVSWAIAPTVLILVAIVASVVPARRAAAIDPLRVLRQ